MAYGSRLAALLTAWPGPRQPGPQCTTVRRTRERFVPLRKVLVTKIPKSHTFAMTFKELGAAFDYDHWVSLDANSSQFSFPWKKGQRPKLREFRGVVVMSTTISRNPRMAAPFDHWLSLYPVSRALYGEHEKTRFLAEALPKLQGWVTTSLAEIDTWPEQGHREYGIELWRGVYRDWEIAWK